MQIIALPAPDAEFRHDVTEAVKVLLRALAFTDYLGLDSEEEEDAVIDLCDALDTESADRLSSRIRRERRATEEAERRLDEWERTEAERRAQRAKAARQLAAEMREKEPALIRAGWSDAELVELHRLRNLGID